MLFHCVRHAGKECVHSRHRFVEHPKIDVPEALQLILALLVRGITKSK